MRAHVPILVIALAASAPLGCAEIHFPSPRTARVEQPGPPPHAPAHGYRRKHDTHAGQVELVFDSGLGVYLVVGWPGHYWQDGHYYREVDGAWQVSARLDTGWSAAPAKRLPPGLAKKAARGKGHKRGPHPAKHGY